jgi:DNA-binding MarR family transcriptional regulator
MPISKKDMEKGTVVDSSFHGSRKEQVLGILSRKTKEGEAQAFQQGEIAKELKIKSPHARQILMDLVDAKIVERKDILLNGKKAVFYTKK